MYGGGRATGWQPREAHPPRCSGQRLLRGEGAAFSSALVVALCKKCKLIYRRRTGRALPPKLSSGQGTLALYRELLWPAGLHPLRSFSEPEDSLLPVSIRRPPSTPCLAPFLYPLPFSLFVSLCPRLTFSFSLSHPASLHLPFANRPPPAPLVPVSRWPALPCSNHVRLPRSPRYKWQSKLRHYEVPWHTEVTPLLPPVEPPFWLGQHRRHPREKPPSGEKGVFPPNPGTPPTIQLYGGSRGPPELTPPLS